MNRFLNPFQEWNLTQTRLAQVRFLPRYARDKETGDRRQGEMTSVAFPTYERATQAVPAQKPVGESEGMR